MANGRRGSLSLFCLVFIPALIYECDGAQCSDGATCHWFMNNKYLCHCEDGVPCDTTSGHCPGGRCDIKWFGPACQYASLSYTINGDSSSKSWLMDANDTTCNDGEEKELKLILDTHQPLTWIRVVVSSKAAIMSLKFQTRCYMPNGTETECRIIESARVDDNTLDIQCPSSDAVKYLTLSGCDVANLCSVYVSGGRNLALKQTDVSQSSSFSGAYATNAVDGKIPQDKSGNDVIYSECTHTDTSSKISSAKTLWWQLIFSRLVKVVRFDIYNRWHPTDGSNNAMAKRLMGFTFNAFDASNTNIFKSTDVNDTEQKIYIMVPSPRLTQPVKRISLILPRESADIFLTICEAVVYGDSECPEGTYGRECEHTCNCTEQKTCFVSTGGCPSGWNFTEGYCPTQCKDGTYGINCSSICSSLCANSTCNKTDGHCTMGCEEGWTGDYCDIKADSITTTVMNAETGRKNKQPSEKQASIPREDHSTSRIWIIFPLLILFLIPLLLLALFLWKASKNKENNVKEDAIKGLSNEAHEEDDRKSHDSNANDEDADASHDGDEELAHSESQVEDEHENVMMHEQSIAE